MIVFSSFGTGVADSTNQLVSHFEMSSKLGTEQLNASGAKSSLQNLRKSVARAISSTDSDGGSSKLFASNEGRLKSKTSG